ncbi:hypothetical protein AIY94_23735 [Salmonella enterica subsp. enterica serovar Typhimurium]|nr:hypothetical protein AIY94_23735 [Salmonella enterica subsp. enterica serovar Typhimurium]
MMSLWDALRMNMMISYQELVRTFLSTAPFYRILSAARFTDNFNALYIFKNASYPCAHQFVVINKKNVDQRNISRIGITLLIVNRPYISWFYLNFET